MHSVSNSSSSTLKAKAKQEFSLPFGERNGLEIRKIDMKVDHKDEEHMVQKLSFGLPTNKQTRVILLVGATGTGKTTLINTMVNYIFGVEFADNFRFILVDDDDSPTKTQAESQTDLITAYILNYVDGMPFDYNYVLIDTPGFGDTRGIQRDREMMLQMEMFLKQSYGIDAVDGVGFVTGSTAVGLTQTQRYVYDGLSSIFGRDIKQNIDVMATFAESKTPTVLKALKTANFEYSNYYKFNNSALFASNSGARDSDENSDSDDSSDCDGDSDSAAISKFFWEMGYRSIYKFFMELAKRTPVSLILTKEVLKKRSQLQIVLDGVEKQIQLSVFKLTNLTQEQDMIKQFCDEMKGCENYEEEMEVPIFKKIDLENNEYINNCINCNMTCHYPCNEVSNEVSNEDCLVISEGICTICPNKCPWDRHKLMNFRYETTLVKEKRTVQELFNRYNNATQGKLLKEQVVEAIKVDINSNVNDLISKIQQAKSHVQRLEEIALKANPLTTKEYIDLMIASEKIRKAKDFEKRIEVLKNLKEDDTLIQREKSNPEETRF